jgi:hypothetical protein
MDQRHMERCLLLTERPPHTLPEPRMPAVEDLAGLPDVGGMTLSAPF